MLFHPIKLQIFRILAIMNNKYRNRINDHILRSNPSHMFYKISVLKNLQNCDAVPRKKDKIKQDKYLCSKLSRWMDFLPWFRTETCSFLSLCLTQKALQLLFKFFYLSCSFLPSFLNGLAKVFKVISVSRSGRHVPSRLVHLTHWLTIVSTS